jgi:hypothetical protein
VDVAETPVVRGPEAAEQAQAVGARALATDGIVFLPDEAGEIDSPEARGLLAHELVHIAQQEELGEALPEEESPEGLVLEAQARATEQAVRGDAGARPPSRLMRADSPDVVAPLLTTGLARQERDGTFVFVPPPRAGQRVQRAASRTREPDYSWQREAVENDPAARTREAGDYLSGLNLGRALFGDISPFQPPAAERERRDREQGAEFEERHLELLQERRTSRHEQVRGDAERARARESATEIWSRDDAVSRARRQAQEAAELQRRRDAAAEEAQRVRAEHLARLEPTHRTEYSRRAQEADDELNRYYEADRQVTEQTLEFNRMQQIWRREQDRIDTVDEELPLRQPERHTIENPVGSPVAVVRDLDALEETRRSAEQDYETKTKELAAFIETHGLDRPEGGTTPTRRAPVARGGPTTGGGPSTTGGATPPSPSAGGGGGGAARTAAAAMIVRSAASTGGGGSSPARGGASGSGGAGGAADLTWQEGRYGGIHGENAEEFLDSAVGNFRENVQNEARLAAQSFLDTFRRPFMSQRQIEEEDRERSQDAVARRERDHREEIISDRVELLNERVEAKSREIANELRIAHPDRYADEAIADLLPVSRRMITRGELQDIVRGVERERPVQTIDHSLARLILDDPVLSGAPEEMPDDRLAAAQLRTRLQQRRAGGTDGAPVPDAAGRLPAETGGTAGRRAGTGAGAPPVPPRTPASTAPATASSVVSTVVAPATAVARYTAPRGGDPERSVITDQRGGEVDLDLINMEELARRVYLRLRSRLRTELLVDRERAGLLSDFR